MFASVLMLTLSFADPDVEAPAAPAYEAAEPGEAARPSGVTVENVLLTLIEQRDVPARESGILVALPFREGDLVKPDAELGRIDDADAKLAEKRAEVDLDIARAKAADESTVHIAEKSLELAEEDLARTVAARKKVDRAITDADLQRDELRRDVAQLELEKAAKELSRDKLTSRLKETELELAQQAVARRRIVSPIGGMVVQVHRRPGEWIEPSEPVLRILRMDELRAEAFLDANVAGAELVGREVTVFADLAKRTNAEFEGRVVFVSPEVNPVDRMVRVWVDVRNPDLALRPGLRVRMTIHDAAAEEEANARQTAERK